MKLTVESSRCTVGKLDSKSVEVNLWDENREWKIYFVMRLSTPCADCGSCGLFSGGKHVNLDIIMKPTDSWKQELLITKLHNVESQKPLYLYVREPKLNYLGDLRINDIDETSIKKRAVSRCLGMIKRKCNEILCHKFPHQHLHLLPYIIPVWCIALHLPFNHISRNMTRSIQINLHLEPCWAFACSASATLPYFSGSKM